MNDTLRDRALELQRRIGDEGIDLVLLTDPISINYVAGFWGYVGIEFGRLTILCVPPRGELTLITGHLESEMARAMSWVDKIRTYADGIGGEWLDPLKVVYRESKVHTIGVEFHDISVTIVEQLRNELRPTKIVDISHILSEMRMVKGPDEIAVARKAGQVAVAMATAARDAIDTGVPEYEVALAIIAGGTRKAAELMAGDDPNSFESPVIHNLQPIQSGRYTSIPHRRSTTRPIQWGDPVVMCFCGIASFKHFHLGFDRQFFLGKVSEENGKIYEVAVAGQQAAIRAMRPGVTAEEVHFAAAEPYLRAGLKQPSHRTGRAVGYAVNEMPQLKVGDKTRLKAGMVFSVGGDVTLPGKCCGRVADTILVTETGVECLTEFPRDLRVLKSRLN